jgi:large subunit ribosomal protein L44
MFLKGMQITQQFIKAHILSRSLPPLSTLHVPINPFQELTTLCERLKIPLPISRLIAESGRYTHAPVFVVGVYSGREKLGEGQGRSLKEAKTRACINGLRAWYLYEQAGWEFAIPSRTEENDKTYAMGYVDPGSIVI